MLEATISKDKVSFLYLPDISELSPMSEKCIFFQNKMKLHLKFKTVNFKKAEIDKMKTEDKNTLISTDIKKNT